MKWQNQVLAEIIITVTKEFKTVTNSFMFPWERRQMEDNKAPLKTWEKVYWWVFIGGIAFLLFSWAHRRNTQSSTDKKEKVI